MDVMPNNDAIGYCWEQYKPSYELAAGCAHTYIAENTRLEIERMRKDLRDNPIEYPRKRILIYTN